MSTKTRFFWAAHCMPEPAMPRCVELPAQRQREVWRRQMAQGVRRGPFGKLEHHGICIAQKQVAFYNSSSPTSMNHHLRQLNEGWGWREGNRHAKRLEWSHFFTQLNYMLAWSNKSTMQQKNALLSAITVLQLEPARVDKLMRVKLCLW